MLNKILNNKAIYWKNKTHGIFFAFVLLVLCNIKGQAQSIASYYNPSPYNALYFETYTDCSSGSKTASNSLHVQYSNNGRNYPSGYNLKAIANTNFTNGVASVPASNVSLKLNTPGDGAATGSQVPLSTATETTIATSTATLSGNYYFDQVYDVTVSTTGGYLLMVPTGDYTSTITLNWYDSQNEKLIASTTIQLKFHVDFSNTCSGVNLSNTSNNFGNAPFIRDYDDVQNGRTVSQAITIHYNPNNSQCIGWSLKVHANGPFTNSTGGTIDPSKVSMAFNSVTKGNPSAAQIGVSNTPVALSTSDVTLINNSQAPFDGQETDESFDVSVAAGNYLLTAGTGDFTTTLTFEVWNQAGTMVATFDLSFTINIAYSNPNSTVVTLTDPNVILQFSSGSDYINGVSVTKTQGLEVLAYEPYYIKIETQDANLTSSEGGTLTPSVIQITSAPNPAKTGIVTYPINLAYAWQNVIANPMTNSTFQDIKYDLTYSISGNNGTVMSTPPGTYSSVVIYQFIAQ